MPSESSAQEVAQPVRGARAFGTALLDPQQPVPEGIVGPDGAVAPKRFNVYRNNVIVGLVEAIRQTYPAIERLLGEEYFAALARAFVVAQPPQSPVLIWYGGAFADFIADFPPLAAYPYLSDVARAEWAWLTAYHAADEAPLDPAALGLVAGDAIAGVRLRPHPAAVIVASAFPLLDILRANRFDTEVNSPLDLSVSQTVLVTRPDLDVHVHLVSAGTARFFLDLAAGVPLAAAAELAAGLDPSFDLSSSLSELLSWGAFGNLDFD